MELKKIKISKEHEYAAMDEKNYDEMDDKEMEEEQGKALSNH